MDYERDPKSIYDQSFATIAREAQLDGFPPALQNVAIRMIHACGMVDLAGDIVATHDVVDATRDALRESCPVICDCEMVRSGITAKAISAGNELIVTLNDIQTPVLAKQQGTTRSAAAVELWRDKLEGAVVVIGNAPTALFHLLEMIADNGPKPAAIIAAPVGFVGAVESKQALIDANLSIPYITVKGRRGGSAITAAAFNAIGLDARP